MTKEEIESGVFCEKCNQMHATHKLRLDEFECEHLICDNCHDELEEKLASASKHFLGIDKVKQGFEIIFEGLSDELGLDTEDENFKGTPERIARAYYELFSGLKNTDKQIDSILKTSFPANGQNSLIIMQNIDAWSFCPHHMLTVEYKVNVGYIPDGKRGRVIGASKIPRLVEILAKRPVLQETFTEDIANALEKIKPEATAVHVVGRHMCMSSRGIKMKSNMITSTVRGGFRTNVAARQEFFDLLKLPVRL
jgi:GTP cyclohydrolase IA